MSEKIFKYALSALMAVILAVCFTSCGGDNDEPDKPASDGNSYSELIIGKWMLPSDWGEAYYFKADGTARGFEINDNGTLRETWDNIWVIRNDKLYLTEDYSDDPTDNPETLVFEIISITSTRAVFYDEMENETITCTKVSRFPWESYTH